MTKFTFIANCGHLLLSASNNSKPNVVYSGLPVEGAAVNFTCPAGMVLNGNSTAICMGNGEWKPDPEEVKCIGIIHILKYYASLLQGRSFIVQ